MNKRLSKIVLVMGGVSSGKSLWAESLINDMHKSDSAGFYYFTPASLPEDEEMRAKVAAHRSRRSDWLETVECGTGIVAGLEQLKTGDTVLFDSVGTLAGRLIMEEQVNPGSMMKYAIQEFCSAVRAKGINLIFVSEEAGMTLVALSGAGRLFQKIMGETNQLIASLADDVFFITAGLPQKLK